MIETASPQSSPPKADREAVLPFSERVSWDVFPKSTQRVLSGILEDLSYGDVGYEPGYAEKIRDGVVEALSAISRAPLYDKLSNSQIAVELDHYAKGITQPRELRLQIRMLSATVSCLAKPRKKNS